MTYCALLLDNAPATLATLLFLWQLSLSSSLFEIFAPYVSLPGTLCPQSLEKSLLLVIHSDLGCEASLIAQPKLALPVHHLLFLSHPLFFFS